VSVDLGLKSAEDCQWDALSLGEIMLRLDPGDGRVRTAREFKVWEGGGEYNVVRGLRKVFGLRSGVLTALVDNEVGHLVEDFVMQGGVDTSLIRWVANDGVGRTARNGLNFVERGYGVRGSVGASDRGHTAISQTKASDWDLDEIFVKKGVRWLHTGGIFAALSETTADVAIEAIRCAKQHGTTVSYDLNYRPSLWKDCGGPDRAREVNQTIAPLVDVLVGNEEDFHLALGVAGAKPDASGACPVAAYERLLGEVAKKYPQLNAAAVTLRTVRTATRNDWTALCWYDGKIYAAPRREDVEVLDRVGGGDAFMSGLIYGLLKTGDPQKAVEYGAAHGALAMTTSGDTSMASLAEVERLMSGGNARVVR